MHCVSYCLDCDLGLRPGKRSTGTRDKQAEKRDVPAKTGRVATLYGTVWQVSERAACRHQACSGHFILMS